MKRPIFFCHIPKTGGTSLRTAIEGQFKPFEIVPDIYQMIRNKGDYPRVDTVLETVSAARIPIGLLRGHYHYSLHEILQNPIKIAVLREPVARSISLLKHMMAHTPAHRAAMLEALDKGNFPAPDNQMTRYLGGTLKSIGGDITQRHDELMRSPIANTSNRLAHAEKVLETIDILGVTEHLERLAEPLAELGIVLPRTRLNEAKIPDLELNERQLETIRDHNKLDISLYTTALKRIGLDK